MKLKSKIVDLYYNLSLEVINNFKVGDVVECMNPFGVIACVKKGEICTVKGFEDDSLLKIENSNGKKFNVYAARFRKINQQT